MIPLTTMRFLSPDSLCYSFDDRANGYSRGEGFGVIVLKCLRDALRDGNTIRAVIRASGSNSDGKSLGLTQPSNTSQKAVIRQAYAAGGLGLDQTRYFEAHGTGTAVGDPIEANAIGNLFAPSRSPEEPLYVGAVKSNIGHLEGCSGVAGLIKTVLVLEHGMIPPNVNFENINPKIDPAALNIILPLKNCPWPTDGLRRASINSFGYGGSNAHVILDDAYNYLKSRNLKGKHRTANSPPSQDVIEKYNSLIVRRKNSAHESDNEVSGKGPPNEIETKNGDRVKEEKNLSQSASASATEELTCGGPESATNGIIEEPAATVDFSQSGAAAPSIKEFSHRHSSSSGRSSSTSDTRIHASQGSIEGAKSTSQGSINSTAHGVLKYGPDERIEADESVKQTDKEVDRIAAEVINEDENKVESPEEVKPSFISQLDAPLKLFMWSSADEGGPNRFASVFIDYLAKVLRRIQCAEEEQVFLRDLVFTLSLKRSMLPYKTYSTASTLAMLIENLKRGFPKATQPLKDAKLGFVFTGQGAQWHAMGRELLHVPQFKSSLQAADNHFRSLGCNWSIFGESRDIVPRIVS
jgi:hypothetical protein